MEEAEVTIHGTVMLGRTLIECTACGPVAVTDAPLDTAINDHMTEHDLERSSR